MSHYIHCPTCNDATLDVDTLHCDECGYYPGREAEQERDVLREGVRAIRKLMAESRGVVGLHLNGDEAPWGELRTGGACEDWLRALDDAIALVPDETAIVPELTPCR